SPRKNEYYVVLFVGFTAGLSRIVLLFTEPYLVENNIAEDNISTLLTLTALCVLGSYMLTAFAGDLWGRKPLLIIYSLMMPIGVFILIAGANMGNYGVIILGAAFCFAAFWGMIGVIRLVTIEILPTERRGTGAGFRSLIVAVGITIGLFLGFFLIYYAQESLEIPFIILTVPCFVNIPLVIKYIKETKHVDLSEIKD
ncbi:MAG: MFS transporter, partial [Promethearchaeota archaeon]